MSEFYEDSSAGTYSNSFSPKNISVNKNYTQSVISPYSEPEVNPDHTPNSSGNLVNWIRHHITLSVVIGIVALAVIVGIVLLARLCVNKCRSESIETLKKRSNMVPNSGSNIDSDFYFQNYITEMMSIIKRGKDYQSMLSSLLSYRLSFVALYDNLDKKWIISGQTIDDDAIDSVKSCVRCNLEKDDYMMGVTDVQELMIELINLDNSYGKYLKSKYSEKYYYWSMTGIEIEKDALFQQIQLKYSQQTNK